MKNKKSASKNTGSKAEKILVSTFRQIHHLPLIWQGDDVFDFDGICESVENQSWSEIKNPIRAMAENQSKADPDVFNEFVYFHNFARKFLYPHGPNKPFRLFQKKNPGTIKATFGNDAGDHSFTIERLTLHIFRTKVAILTVETLHDTSAEPLTLAQTQTIIDHFRRSYTPFWNQNGDPEVVPLKLSTSDGIVPTPQTQTEMVEFLEKNRDIGADAPLLEPWKSWVSPLEQKDWSDPSDERIPVMSFILLKKTQATNRDTLNLIKDSDWYRLAEADAGGDEFAYNPEFLEKMKSKFFYDRFMPNDAMPDYLATRHIFGGAHYSVVSVDDDFSQNVIQSHFRRHYEKLALAVRFEYATLLAFSSRISHAVENLEGDGRTSNKKSNKFRQEIRSIHEDFLEFTHRYRFTGITSQIQGAEMFDRWRASLDLNRLYDEVKDEITSASEFVMAVRADEKAGKANYLALVGLLVGVLLSAPPLKEFSLFSNWIKLVTAKLCNYGWTSAGLWVEFFLPITVVSVLFLALWMAIKLFSFRKST